MQYRKSIQLLQQYLRQKATLAEKARVDKWYHATDEMQAEGISEQQLNNIKQSIYHQIQTGIAAAPVVPLYKRSFFRIGAAAIFILLLGSGVYYLNNKLSKLPAIIGGTGGTVGTREDIAPGGNKAIWTLADGKKIELDSTVLDMTIKERKLDKVGYNELRTPRGGQYQLILPDGSKVWLNAASSIRYPVAFTGKERKITITGEAYFEITKDATKPFKVYGADQEIEVLGTSFNINIYNDEPVKKTTLITGSIKITNNNQTAILKPGQQANISILEIPKIRLIPVQTSDVIAWTTGLFSFNNASLQTVMRQLSRWYDVEVVYEGAIPAMSFGGQITRKTNLNDVIKILEESNIHCRIEGRKIIVRP